MSARSALRVALVVGLAGWLSLATATIDVAGAEPLPARQVDDLDLVGQTTWLDPGEDFELDLRVAAAPGRVIAVDIHDRVRSRSEFQQAYTEGPTSDVIGGLDPQPVDELLGTSGILSLRLPTRPEGTDGEGPALAAQGGVYPVTVTLGSGIDDGSEPARLVTFLVARPQPEDGTVPLAVATLVPMEAPLAYQPDGSVDLDPTSVDRLERLSGALTRWPAPATLLPRPETLWSLARSDRPEHADLLQRLRDGAATREVLATPFVAMDPARWLPSDPTRFASELDAGQRALVDLLGVTPTVSTWWGRSAITSEVLAGLTDLGVERLVADEARFEPLEPGLFPLTLAQPFTVDLGDRSTLPGAAIDAALDDHLRRAADPELAAHRLLADLAVLYFDRPAQQRGVVVALPNSLLPEAVYDIYLGGLSDQADDTPLLRPTTTEELFSLVSPATQDPSSPDGPELTRTVVGREVEPVTADVTTALTYAELAVDSYETVVSAPGQAAGLREIVTVAASDELDATERDAYLRVVYDTITAGISGVAAPEAQTITITARNATLPLQFGNELTTDVEVLVVLESDKLEFPDGGEFTTTLPPGITRLDVPVRSRAAGDATLQVTLRSPDGRLQLDRSRLVVRSAVFSGVGIAISAVAIAVLVLWWGREIVRGRRRRAADTAEPEPDRPPRPQEPSARDEVASAVDPVPSEEP